MFGRRNYDYNLAKKSPARPYKKHVSADPRYRSSIKSHLIKMNDKDDSAWVFDSLIGFLQGPIWSSPLMTFIEEKSLGSYNVVGNVFTEMLSLRFVGKLADFFLLRNFSALKLLFICIYV